MSQTLGGMFYGWLVVAAAFVIAIFGWGVGFYGPAIYLKTVQDTHGWSVGLASVAVTLHFLIGAFAVANLPRLHRRFGLPRVTVAGACLLALGVIGWATAVTPWQLLLATLLSGSGWVALGAAGINAMVSPWFAQKRPAALAMAYNGASIGGVIFSPLWVALIAAYGFRAAALGVGITMVVVVSILALTVLARSPQGMGLAPDGLALQAGAVVSMTPSHGLARVGSLWRDPAFLTLACGMALGLFAQIGLIAHLYSLLVPSMGAQTAGFVAGLATAAAILGRTVVGWTLRPGTDRRRVAAVSYAVQIGGGLCLAFAAGAHVPLLILGVFLFGLGIGNATSLPPMITQTEFTKDDVPRTVALVTAVSQGTYAFAPMVFGLIRDVQDTTASGSPVVFLVAVGIQALAALCFLKGRGAYLAR